MTRTLINLTSRKAVIPKDVKDQEKFENNWDAIFKKKPVDLQAPEHKDVQLPTTIGVNT